MAQSLVKNYFTLRTVLISSFLLRLGLVAYGELQDRWFAVKFTDVDYHVFSDAAKHVTEGASPYQRPTYRYTPLLAILLTPNHYLFPTFGKLLFVGCDLIAGWLIDQLLAQQGVGADARVVSCAVWLLNPLTATVSSRGNAEAILAVLVLGCLYCFAKKCVGLSAVLYGLAVHMKVFPAIYSLPLFLALDTNYSGLRSRGRTPSFVAKYLNPSRVQFVVISLLTFLSITAILCFRYCLHLCVVSR